MSSIQDHLGRSNTASSSAFALSHGPAESDSPHSPMQLDTPSPGNLDDLHPHLLHGIVSEASSSSGSGSRVGAVATEYGAPSVTDPKRVRQRRVMPTRLHRVSSLLAGSLEEEIAGATAKGDAAALLPGTTKVILTTRQDRYASEIVIGNFAEKGMLYGHIRKEQIQTPEFRTRDDTEVLGKTRSLRSEEDTSDEAFERRHRKADNVEKRVRKWEKDNLKKDRLKIIERIESLKTADIRVFLPVLNAREQRHQASATAESDSKIRTDSDDASGKPESTHPLQDNTNLTEADPSSMGQGREAKLEQLRDDLIEQHKLILQRYDTLLTVPDDESTVNASTSASATSNAVSGHKRKSLHRDENASTSGRIKRSTSDTSLASQKPRRTISVSGTFARKEGRASNASASTSSSAPGSTSRQRSGLTSSKSMDALPTDPLKKPNTKYSARDKRANRIAVEQPTPRPFTDEDGKVRAENTYANIHARTSGGRFAPKNALGSSGTSSAPRSKINTKMGRQSTQQRQRQRRSNASSASAPKEAVVATDRTDKDDPASSAAQSNAIKKTRRSSTSTRMQSPASEKSAPGIPTGDDSTAGQSSRTRRVKLIFSRSKEAGSDVGSGSPVPSKTIPSVAGVKREDERMDEDEKPSGEGSSSSRAPSAATKVTPARSALTLEEAQALLAKAMADGDDEDEVDEDARDAANAAASIFPPP